MNVWITLSIHRLVFTSALWTPAWYIETPLILLLKLQVIKQFFTYLKLAHLTHDYVIKYNLFSVTGPLWGKTTGYWWIPLTKSSDGELWCFLFFFLIWDWTNGWANTRDAGDLRRHRAHCVVTVMCSASELPTVSTWQFHEPKTRALLKTVILASLVASGTHQSVCQAHNGGRLQLGSKTGFSASAWLCPKNLSY